MRRLFPAAPLAVLVAASSLAGTPAAAGTGAEPAGGRADRTAPRATAPLLRGEPGSELQGRYIVVLEEGVRARAAASVTEVAEVAEGSGADVTNRFEHALTGFAAELPPSALSAVRAHPDVAFVEADQRVGLAATQDGATWGLDRIDQRGRHLNGSYRYDATGAGVTAYVIDTGIRAGHREFGDRVKRGFTSVKDGRGTKDCNGHGTHVAGTVGGKKYGVAKKVTLRPVRVLNCPGAGSVSGVIKGIDWVADHHRGTRPAVANMSLGGPYSVAEERAVSRAIADGVTFVVSAGNESVDACQFTPAAVPNALTVGATTKGDERARFSNKGTCVDAFAPGQNVTSAWIRSNRDRHTISGTSMASPHVAGVAALYLQANPSASPAQVGDAVLRDTTTGVSGRAGSPDRLLFSRLDTALLPPPVDALDNGGFEAGPSGWSGLSGIVNNDDADGGPARSGSWKAWLGGYGESRSDRLWQNVTIPSGGSPRTLSFWLRVTTAESDPTAHDMVLVDMDVDGFTTRIATYSNVDAGGYVQSSLDVSGFAGRTVTLRFTSVEDSSNPTSFVVDDVALATG